jgi:hypothetical protein
MQELPHGLPVTHCGFFVCPPLKHELINCFRASPVMPLACVLQSFIREFRVDTQHIVDPISHPL